MAYNLINQKINKWLVIDRLPPKGNGSPIIYKCVCECGNIGYVSSKDLRKNKSRQCRKCALKKINGLSNSKIYKTYHSMKNRCLNPNEKIYKYYGGRGIKICNEWLDEKKGFMNFYNWSINNGYDEKLTIDRIDTNGNYEPKNCRWVTMAEQNRNHRRNVNIEINNVKKCLTDWIKDAGMDYEKGRGYYRYYGKEKFIEMIKNKGVI